MRNTKMLLYLFKHIRRARFIGSSASKTWKMDHPAPNAYECNRGPKWIWRHASIKSKYGYQVRVSCWNRCRSWQRNAATEQCDSRRRVGCSFASETEPCFANSSDACEICYTTCNTVNNKYNNIGFWGRLHWLKEEMRRGEEKRDS